MSIAFISHPLRPARPVRLFLGLSLAVLVVTGCDAIVEPVLEGPDASPLRAEVLAASATGLWLGSEATCALRGTGVVDCWGSMSNGGAPATWVAPTGTYTQVGGGYQQACAVRSDGTAHCRGINDLGGAPAFRSPTSSTFTQVTGG